MSSSVSNTIIEQTPYQSPQEEVNANEFVIEMSSIDQMTVEAAKERFQAIVPHVSDEDALKRLCGLYLPSMEDQNFRRIDRIRLCYLSTFKKDGEKSPFLEEHIEVFKASHREARLNLGCLKYAILPFTVISSSSFIGLLGTTSLSTLRVAAISGTVGAISSVALNMLSLYITGINPTRSKDADNAKQSMVQRVKGIYDELAKELMELNLSSPESAKDLANKIEVQLLREAGERDYLDKNDLEDIFDLFQDAILYIRKEREYPRSHDLRGYMYNNSSDSTSL